MDDEAPEPKHKTSVELPLELLQEIDRIASKENRSRNGQIVFFLAQIVRQSRTYEQDD